MNVSVASGYRISTVEYLRHDFVAEVEIAAGDSRLMRSDEQPHERRRPRRRFRRFAELGDRIHLTNSRLVVYASESKANHDQQRRTGAAARDGRIGSVA